MSGKWAVRHNAAFGALLGLAVGEAVSRSATLPPVICGHRTDFVGGWGSIGDRAFAQAERTLRGHPTDIDLTPAEVIPAAIRLADDDAGPPLLIDGDAATACEVVRDALTSRIDLEPVAPLGPDLRRAIEAVRSTDNFVDAVATSAHAEESCGQLVALTGGLAGCRWGPGAIPASWSTYLHGPVGPNTYRLRQLRRLAERLLRLEAPLPPEPRRWLGPSEVAPKLWMSNLPAVVRFTHAHPDGAIVSLCPTTGAFDDHPLRREFIVHDQSGRVVNPHLGLQVEEVLATIDAFHAEGRDVLVHCQHGASRTGLVLRAWLMRHDGLSVEDATAEAQARWSKTSTWNRAFTAELERRSST